LPGFRSRSRWLTLVDTSFPTGQVGNKRYARGSAYPLQARSLVLLRQITG
jgi:hypothetical protein